MSHPKVTGEQQPTVFGPCGRGTDVSRAQVCRRALGTRTKVTLLSLQLAQRHESDWSRGLQLSPYVAPGVRGLLLWGQQSRKSLEALGRGQSQTVHHSVPHTLSQLGKKASLPVVRNTNTDTKVSVCLLSWQPARSQTNTTVGWGLGLH